MEKTAGMNIKMVTALKQGVSEATEKAKFQERTEKERAAADILRGEYRGKATITEQELVVGRRPGVTLLDPCRGPFEFNIPPAEKGVRWESVKLFHVFCLVDYNEEEGFQVLEYPERLKKYFEPFATRRWKPDGNKFEGLQFLGALLRMAYGKHTKTVRREEEVLPASEDVEREITDEMSGIFLKEDEEKELPAEV